MAKVGGHAWQRGDAWRRGACMAKGGHVWYTPPPEIRPVIARAVRILLECILVAVEIWQPTNDILCICGYSLSSRYTSRWWRQPSLSCYNQIYLKLLHSEVVERLKYYSRARATW